jgi:predicted thioesterase
MTAKREKRYVGAGSTTYLEFNLDPDIYKAGVATALGVNAAAPTGSGVEIVPYTLKLARRSTSVVIIRMKMERDVAGETESRRIDLVCDKNNADTAKAALNNLTVNIGPANSAWTLKA